MALTLSSVLSFGAEVIAQSASGGPSQGTPIDVGVMTFPPGTNSSEHPHGVTEIFYVLEGELEHIVNGDSHMLTPGMLE